MCRTSGLLNAATNRERHLQRMAILAGFCLSVVVACSGPGAHDLMSGIADASHDLVPCLFTCGQVDQKEMKAD